MVTSFLKYIKRKASIEKTARCSLLYVEDFPKVDYGNGWLNYYLSLNKRGINLRFKNVHFDSSGFDLVLILAKECSNKKHMW